MAEGSDALERLQALDSERRAILLETAAAQFASNGFAGTSLNAILKAVGMSKGQAYYYITGKGDLYHAVIKRSLGELVAQLDLALPDAPESAEAFWAGLFGMFRQVTAVLIARPQIAALGRTMYESAETDAALESLLGDLNGVTADLVRRGQAVGAIREDMPLSLLVTVLFASARALDRWFAENWADLDEAAAYRYSAGALDMVRAMLSPPGTSASV